MRLTERAKGLVEPLETALTAVKQVLEEPLFEPAQSHRHFKVATRNPVVIAGPLKVDLVSRRVELKHIEIALTKNEYHLLHILASHLGLVVPYDLLLKEIWPDNQRFTLQYLRVLIRQLREKIEADANQPRLVLNESGVGYRLSWCS